MCEVSSNKTLSWIVLVEGVEAIENSTHEY
jgi:hypothetical protein